MAVEVDAAVIKLAAQRKRSQLKIILAKRFHNFLHQSAGHVITGPIHTNVMDIVVVLLP